MFLLNSRLGHFSAAPRRGHPLSRSYRVNLPSSLAMDHSSSLEYSSRLPVSVCGTGCILVSLGNFLGSLIRVIIRLSEDARYCHLRQTLRVFRQRLYLRALTHYSVSAQTFHYFVLPSLSTQVTGILTSCPSPFPFGLGLGPD